MMKVAFKSDRQVTCDYKSFDKVRLVTHPFGAPGKFDPAKGNSVTAPFKSCDMIRKVTLVFNGKCERTPAGIVC